jgi:hypothetical protein
MSLLFTVVDNILVVVAVAAVVDILGIAVVGVDSVLVAVDFQTLEGHIMLAVVDVVDMTFKRIKEKEENRKKKKKKALVPDFTTAKRVGGGKTSRT